MQYVFPEDINTAYLSYRIPRKDADPRNLKVNLLLKGGRRPQVKDEIPERGVAVVAHGEGWVVDRRRWSSIGQAEAYMEKVLGLRPFSWKGDQPTFMCRDSFLRELEAYVREGWMIRELVHPSLRVETYELIEGVREGHLVIDGKYHRFTLNKGEQPQLAQEAPGREVSQHIRQLQKAGAKRVKISRADIASMFSQVI